jgi:hypothetical protein
MLQLDHKFVELLPDQLEAGVLYVCMQYATASHKCCCGCGRDVVTPISPTDWQMTFDGRSISLTPSIGNWSYPCRSHYWIQRSNVMWEEADFGTEALRPKAGGLLARIRNWRVWGW